MDSHRKRTRSMPISRRPSPPIAEVKRVSLALQGGGWHGAFTWGVLDRLLEVPRIELEGVSATSSGAMNAVVMAHGLTIGGREGAREALEDFWHRIARLAAPFGALQVFELVSRFLSPYQLNPFNYNPLRRLIEHTVDFERLRQDSAIRLFLSAYHAVEVEGEHYWDGGYMGNPVLFPLIYSCESRDILVVHINPMERAEVPTTSREIMNRVNEISFN